MSNYKLTIQYDGTKYNGWQIQQSSDNTIQGKLISVINRLTNEEVNIIGSGRTDAGVHAKAQIANVHLKKEYDTGKLLAQINHYLPEDIAVTDISIVDERFHARFNAISKRYQYRIYTGIYPNVFERKYVYTYLDKELNVEEMIKASKYLLGTHDFMSFCGNKHMKKSAVRTISDIQIKRNNNEIVIDYIGDGFLQNMIRIITGTLIEVGNGSKNHSDIPAILDSHNRENAGFTAPASGLCLMEVNY